MDKQNRQRIEMETFRKMLGYLGDDEAMELLGILSHKLYLLKGRIQRPRKIWGFDEAELDKEVDRIERDERTHNQLIEALTEAIRDSDDRAEKMAKLGESR